jgi:photosystem II stability/assembly factor-like uncharacterized protein
VTLRDVTYTGRVFLAVGEEGAIFTSPDGNTWTSWPLGNNLKGVAYGGNRFVAVGSRGTILTSSDGISWNPSDSKTQRTLLGVTHANGRFVIVGERGTILTSSDGAAWKQQASKTTQNLHGVAFGKGVYVAVGERIILYSRDASSWAPAKLNPIWESAYFRGVAFGNGRFVAVGDLGSIYTSTDGINWNLQLDTGKRFFAVTYGNNRFMAVGLAIFSSSDGLKWTDLTSKAFSTFYTPTMLGVAFGDRRFVVVTYSGNIYTSLDGITWTPREPLEEGFRRPLNAVAYGGGRFVAVGERGLIVTSP